jgi:transposase
MAIQKKSRTASERDETKRTAFRERIATLRPTRLVFLDECGFALNLHRLYGWAKSSERCVESVPFQRGVNRSVLGAFGLSGMVALSQKLGAFKRVDFVSFLKEELLPRLPTGSVLVLDNARIHQGEVVTSLVEQAGCSLMYLPPYSPDFSPIELAWSMVKGMVRDLAPREDVSREEAVNRVVGMLSSRQAEAWFRKCGYEQGKLQY